MATKRKSEILIFLGFVVLAISFIGMIFYFQVQTKLLNEKQEEIKAKQDEIEIRTVDLKLKENELLERQNQLDSVKKLVAPDKIARADAIFRQTDEQIKLGREQIFAKSGIKNVIYVQVGSNETKSKLIDQKFIATLNSNTGYNVINAYDVKKGADNTIRYFNIDDEKLAQQLQRDIQQKFSINLKLSHAKGFSVNKGQLEIWIK